MWLLECVHSVGAHVASAHDARPRPLSAFVAPVSAFVHQCRRAEKLVQKKHAGGGHRFAGLLKPRRGRSARRRFHGSISACNYY